MGKKKIACGENCEFSVWFWNHYWTTVWGPILGTFKHYSMYCDSAKLSRQNVPVHSCYIFSAFCSIKHFRISCRFRCFTADFRSTSAAPILGSCDPIIGPVAGALQSQRDVLAHRAWLTREQSSIENDVGIQVTHLLVLCHLTDEKLNKTTVNSAILTQNLDYFNVSIYSLKIQTTFVQIVLFSGHKHEEKFNFWKLTPLDCSL